MTLLRAKDVSATFGWSITTIWRKVKQGCFPCYRLSSHDVRYSKEEILHYIQGTREGNFDQRGIES